MGKDKGGKTVSGPTSASTSGVCALLFGIWFLLIVEAEASGAATPIDQGLGKFLVATVAVKAGPPIAMEFICSVTTCASGWQHNRRNYRITTIYL
ncbi:MAG: hypothetical protein ACE5EM_12100 [Sphingomonadales bacterium]